MNLFFELIQVAIGNRNLLSKNPTENEWEELFVMAQKQAVAGIAFEALDKLSKQGQQIGKVLLFEWLGIAQQIKEQNLIVNKRCKDITIFFEKAGFKTCILKGQGNARMYPNPLARNSGDIDIWVFGERKAITRFVKERTPDAFEEYRHINLNIYDDVPVEVHYQAGDLFVPKYNKRFQKWCNTKNVEIKGNYLEAEGFVVPTVEFNMIYQMVHIMDHFFIEGIGLRHFLDYYYVLKLFNGNRKKDSVRYMFHCLGLEKFAKGVMWIEEQILGIDKQCLIIEPDEQIGSLILKEMLEGGNFGHYDERYKCRNKGLLTRGLTDTYRLLTLIPFFPDFVIWKILNKMNNQKWKIK